MDDVVAITIEDANKGVGAFLIWGRTFDPVDPTKLLKAVTPHLPVFGVYDLLDISVCSTIRKAEACPYFYEGLMYYASQLATQPHTTDAWKLAHSSDEAVLNDLYFLGFVEPTDKSPGSCASE